MEGRFNPFDPLGILGAVKKDVDRIGSSVVSLPLPGPQKGIGNPIPAEFDGKLVDMKGKARERLIAVGYSASIVDKALNWYEEWIMGMARRLAPGDTALQRQVVQAAYAEVEPKAERWIRGIQDAFGISLAK